MNWRHFGSENTGIQQNSIILVSDFYVLKAVLRKYTNFMFWLKISWNLSNMVSLTHRHTQTFSWLNSNTWWKKWSGNNRAYVFHSTYQLLDSWVTRPVDVCVKALSHTHTHKESHHFLFFIFWFPAQYIHLHIQCLLLFWQLIWCGGYQINECTLNCLLEYVRSKRPWSKWLWQKNPKWINQVT